MAVVLGVAVPGEVLHGGGEVASRLVALDLGGGEPGDVLGVGPEGAYADDGVRRVDVHVGVGREVEVEAEPPGACREEGEVPENDERREIEIHPPFVKLQNEIRTDPCRLAHADRDRGECRHASS